MPQDRPETTRLSVKDELRFQAWAHRNGITDVDHPDSHYDYRGYWRSTKGAAHEPGTHFPDTFKQHGHPTFSVESKYSRGPNDGGHWRGDTFVPPANADQRIPQDIMPPVRPPFAEPIIPNVMRAQGARIPQAPATPLRDAFINTPPNILRALANMPFAQARELSQARNPDEAFHALTGVGLSMDPNSPAARPSDARGGRAGQALALSLLALPELRSALGITAKEAAVSGSLRRLAAERTLPTPNLPTGRAATSLGEIRSLFQDAIGGGEALPRVGAVNEAAG